MRKWEKKKDIIFLHFQQQLVFGQVLIRGSMHAERHKPFIWKIFQLHIHSPLYVVLGHYNQLIVRIFVFLVSRLLCCMFAS